MDLIQPGEGPWHLDLVWDEAMQTMVASELRLQGPIHCQALLVALEPGNWRIEAQIQGAQLLTCGRTLEDFLHTYDVKLLADVEKTTGIREQEVDDDDEELFQIRIPVTQEVVDLSECVRQLVTIQEPINPIKDPESDFAWQDPNGEESFSNGTVDPRWEKLKDWKVRNSDEKPPSQQ